MRKFLLILLIFIYKNSFSQLSDNFSDGNFAQNPTWTGNINDFSIISGQLKSTLSSSTQNVALATSNSLALNVKWEMFLQMDFDPSTTNLMRIYLIADAADLNGNINGYFIQIGESGSTDSYDLYRQSGTTITKIIDGPAKTRTNTNEVKARVYVSRTIAGVWELKTDITGGTTYTSEGTVTDNTFTNTTFFGVQCRYTATRSDKYIFDDFSITELIPGATLPPPPPTFVAKENDIVINEIFPDPSPQVDLPSVEFIELWNRTTENISLRNYKYKDATTTFTFGNDTIKANEYLILCARADTAEFKRFGKTLGISPWPSLNNSSDQLSLIGANGTVIHSVNYSDTWYKDAIKKTGGWTLELIDPLSICKPSQNYAASINPTGGTPGRENSVYHSNKTTDPLRLVSATLQDSVTVLLTFNRGLDSLQAAINTHYLINNGVGVPQVVSLAGPEFSSALLKFPSALTRNTNYTITVNGITDCGTGSINNQTLSFIYPGLIEKKDVLINEIIFNPTPNGVDFVEVYNNSNKILDFKDLFLATVNDKDSIVNIKSISTSTLLLQPQAYWVLSTDPDNVKASYQTLNPTNFIKLASLPSFNDDKGVAILLNKKQERVDQLNYDKNMHFGLLKDVEGVSLERSSFTDNANTKGNFRSATASVGYATPAYKNSQYQEAILSEEQISLSSPTISPDNDGFEDVLTIAYNLNQANFVANVSVYNDQGVLVKKLISNEPLSTKGNWTWDGLDQNNNKAKTGLHIIYIELFNLNAEVKKFKKTVAVASKF